MKEEKDERGSSSFVAWLIIIGIALLILVAGILMGSRGAHLWISCGEDFNCTVRDRAGNEAIVDRRDVEALLDGATHRIELRK